MAQRTSAGMVQQAHSGLFASVETIVNNARSAFGAKRPLMAPEPYATSRWLSMDIGCREGIRYFPFYGTSSTFGPLLEDSGANLCARDR